MLQEISGMHLSSQQFLLELRAGLRYMLAVDDAGKKYELAPDPMNEELQEQLEVILLLESRRLLRIS